MPRRLCILQDLHPMAQQLRVAEEDEDEEGAAEDEPPPEVQRPKAEPMAQKFGI